MGCFSSDNGVMHARRFLPFTFTASDPARYTNLVLGLMRDDGAMVHLNGAEIFRSNMPTGAVTYTTPATAAIGGSDESQFVLTNLPPSWLRPGTNVLAVEIHQINGTSSDVSFDLYLLGQSDPATPRLSIHRSGLNLGFDWPPEACDFLLESTTDLNSGSWQPVTGVPVLNNGRVQLTLPPASGNLFYRLTLP